MGNSPPPREHTPVAAPSRSTRPAEDRFVGEFRTKRARCIGYASGAVVLSKFRDGIAVGPGLSWSPDHSHIEAMNDGESCGEISPEDATRVIAHLGIRMQDVRDIMAQTMVIG